ncbi:serine O-acetyltransferase [Rhodococcus sp. JS3073]|uniref:serine O-acetyltransferase n=1 Tax=Rhodococcus sp. JS3073 TaxID=3002901 RepID=UPI003FA7C0C6
MSSSLASTWWPRTADLASFVKSDMQANRRNPKIQGVLFLLRICQVLMGSREKPRPLSVPFVVAYRVLTEFFLGIEVPPKTTVGPGLCVYHGFGLVINDHCVIGRNATIRNGVTIGNRKEGGPVPRIGNGVEIGAGAIILGDITLGDGCRVGAGAVVLTSVAEGETVVGNPARPMR